MFFYLFFSFKYNATVSDILNNSCRLRKQLATENIHYVFELGSGRKCGRLLCWFFKKYSFQTVVIHFFVLSHHCSDENIL